MTWSPPEPDDDDAERLAIVLAPRMKERLIALLAIPLKRDQSEWQVPIMSGKDRGLLLSMWRRDPKTLTPEHRHWIAQLLWRYRKAPEIPATMRPKLNPGDPIVRAMEDAGV